MNSSVCTLFEGNYHYGVAALTNSLYHHGFKGSVYAGYRGSLPKWADHSKEDPLLFWPGARTLQVAKGLTLHLLPISTEYHLTNYKPNFMLRLWEGPAKDADMIAYFDPDIVVKCKWSFFENWMSHGVALVHEIIANDMPATHPLRKEWEKVIYKCNRKPTRELSSYINGGFCGVSKENIEFLHVWKEIFDTGVNYFNLSPDQWNHEYDRTFIFYAQDQDTINITAMCSQSPISEMGPDGMDFIRGGWVMSHALGRLKPWQKIFLFSAILGNPPTSAERGYWANVSGPISLYSKMLVSIKNSSIKIAAFVSRFYRRG
jgi:hypothetical protein